MTATVLDRIAAIVFVLFAVGHTYGFLSPRARSAKGRAVYHSMNAVRFELRGGSYRYGDFYRSFGLSCTVSTLLSALLSWHLEQLARTTPTAVGFMGWTFFALQLPGRAFRILIRRRWRFLFSSRLCLAVHLG